MFIRRSAKILFLAALCAGTSPIVAQEGVTSVKFSPAKMAAAIEATMKPEVVAFSYTIAEGGNVALEKGFGPARIAFDGYRAHGPLQRNNIASVTKTFTAVAILQLIEANKAKGVTVDTRIGAYLPDGWKAGPNVANLSFAELMRHTSGFSSGNLNGVSLLGYDGIKAMVAAGTTPLPAGKTERKGAYDNANYALLRELLPKLWAATGTLKYEKIDGSQIWPTQGDYHAFLYAKYVNMHIFAPLDIEQVKCFDNGPAATLYYPLNPDPKVHGIPGVDQSKFCGSGGMYLSTREMAKFFVYLFQTDKLLPAAVRQTMMDRRLGLDAKNTARGLSFSRNGIVGLGSNSQGKSGTKACMIHLPGGVDAALVQNSGDNASLSPCNVLIAAYEAGWK
jgi:CubicO group peptidase (beta-lactamase class C family)